MVMAKHKQSKAKHAARQPCAVRGLTKSGLALISHEHGFWVKTKAMDSGALNLTPNAMGPRLSNTGCKPNLDF